MSQVAVLKYVSLQLLSASVLLWQSEPSLGPYPVKVPDLSPKNVAELLQAFERQLQPVAADSSAALPVAGADTAGTVLKSVEAAHAAATPVTVASANPAASVGAAVTLTHAPASAPHQSAHAPHAAAVVAPPPAAPVKAAAASVAAPKPAAVAARHKRSIGEVLDTVGDVASVATDAVESAVHAAAKEVVAGTDPGSSVPDVNFVGAEANAPRPHYEIVREKRDVGGIVSEVADTAADVLEHVSRNSPLGGRVSGALADVSRSIEHSTATDESHLGKLLLSH